MFRSSKILLITIAGFFVASHTAHAQSFTLSANSVSLNANAGGQKVSDNHIKLTNSLSGSLSLTLTPSTNSGGNWLSASASPNPVPGKGTSTITITVDPAKLQASNTAYTGKVTVSGGGTSRDITVSVTVNGIAIVASPNPANIGVTAGKSVQANVKLLNTQGGGGAGLSGGANFQSNQTWLSVTNFDGTNITVNVDATSLSVGQNSGTITISYNGQGSPFVPVALVVNAFVSPPPGLVANPSSLSFQVSSGATTIPQPLNVASNDNTTKFSFTATPTVPWIKLSASSGTTTTSLNVTVDASALSAGQYSGSITLSCTGSPSCSSVAVPVSATVTQTRLTANNSSLSFQAYQSRPNPQSQNVLIATTDSNPLGFTVSGAPPWLQVSPLTGTASGSPLAISVTAVTNQLAPGTNTGSFVITPANNTPAIGVNVAAVLSPFTISVSPNPPPAVNINPGKTQTIAFNISTADSAAADIGIATSTNNNSGNWLTAPPSGSAPGRVNVTVDATSLGVGTYSGNVTFSCNSATCNPVQVPVSVTVSSAPTINATPATVSFQPGPNNSLPASQTVSLRSSDQSAQNFSFSVSPAASWLRVTSNQNTTPATLTLSVTSLPSQNSSTNITITPANGSPAVNIPVSLTVSSNGPSIQGVSTASAFGGFSTITSGTYIEIYGTNLATNTRGWAGADFSGVNAPKVLDGVTVDINGQKAFVNFISPGQVNVVVPGNIGTGPVQITLANPAGSSPAFTMNAAAVSPGFFAPGVFTIIGRQYLGAILPDGAFAFPAGAIAGVASRPAKPGETLVLYGLGFGPVTPDIPVGTIVQQANTLRNPLQILFGQTPASLAYDGLSPNFVGLYQFNVVVPAVPDNDAVPVTFNLGGATGPQALFIAVRR